MTREDMLRDVITRFKKNYPKTSKDRLKKYFWRDISINLKLSEDFIREFKDKFSWCCIRLYQTLSQSFINEFKQKGYIK